MTDLLSLQNEGSQKTNLQADLRQAELQPSRGSGVVRAFIAMLVLAVFLGVTAYYFRSDLLPGLLRASNQVRSVGAVRVKIESRYFEVRNDSQASEAQLQAIIRTLEADAEAIQKFLQLPSIPRMNLLVVNGEGIASLNENQLTINYENGVIDLDMAPFLLFFLVRNKPFDPNQDLILQAGLALYVVEEIGRAEGFLRQPCDAWVKLLQSKGELLPLEQALQVKNPQDEADLYDFARALLESGSFTRWLASSYGLEAAVNFADGLGVGSAGGLSMARAEQAWLDALSSRQIRVRPCRMAAGPNSLLGFICEKLDEKNP